MKKYIVLVLLSFVFTYANLSGDWCGTIPALKDYQEGKLPIRPTLSGPEIIIDRTNFRVHYTHQGRDAVSTVYAETTASALTLIWSKMVDTLGWIQPAPDYGQGGDDRFDCYITQLSSGIAGVCYSENSYTTPYPNGACSHIRISNTLDISAGVKVVTCHEFNHACQMRYSTSEQSWWYENCATWIEDLVYDNINDYVHYLTASPNPFSSPELPITTFSGLYQYAGCVWAMFLNDYYDYDCPRKIWHYQGTISGQNTLSGIDYVLNNYYSSNLQTALKKYALWRFFTNTRADTINYFKEGHLYPLAVYQQRISNYPANGNQLNYSPRGPGGTNFLQFTNGGGKFFASFDGQDGYQWTSYMIGYKSGQPSLVYEYSLNTQSSANDSFDWQNRDYFTMIPVVSQWSPTTGQLTYNFSASLRILHDVGITRISGFQALSDSGLTFVPQATVKNYGQFSENFPIKLNVGNFYSRTLNLNISSNDSLVVNFPVCTLKVRGYHNYACSTLLSGDERNSNNSISDRIFIRVRDVGPSAILEPIGNITQGSYIRPRIRIKNYGNAREVFDVDFSIGAWRVTQRFSLSEGLEYDFTFDSIFHATITGNLLVKCSTKLNGDINPNNNRIVSNCCVNPVAVIDKNNISIRNLRIPTIISGNSAILLSNVPVNNRVEVEIFNAVGKNIYYKVFNNEIIRIHKKLNNGLYIIRLKSAEDIIITKSIIIGN